MVGSAIAWQLQTRGAPTTMVGELEKGTSFASFASLSAFDEPLKDVYLLKCLGLGYWRRWNRELDARLGLRWDGEIRWAETPESAHTLSAKIARAIQRGYPVHRISAEELADLLPNSRPAAVEEACRAPEDGQVEPAQAIARLRQELVEAGGRFVDGRASLQFPEDGVRVTVGDEELEAESVVVAAGAESAALLEKMGTDLPMDPSPGLLVITEPTEPVLTGTAYVMPVTWPAIHLRQLEDGRVMIGERSQEFAATKPTMKHARELLRQAQRSFPVLRSARIEHYSVQFRPMPRDGMPIIGPLPGLSSVYVATGHSGITLAPAMAVLIAQELIDGSPAVQLEPFRPARFAEQRTHLAQQIEAAFRSPR